MRFMILGVLGSALSLPIAAQAGRPIQMRVKKVLCVAPSGPFPDKTMEYVGAAIHGDPSGRVPGPINGMQAPMEYGVPIIGMMGPKGKAAAVGLTAGMEGIKQTYEFAKYFDENRVPDDLYIKVNGQKIWPRGASQKIRAGQEVHVGAVAPPAIGGQHRIELWERDTGVFEGDDDLLGDLNFGAGGGLERTLVFTLTNKSEGSVYLVEVEFFRPPPPPVQVRAIGSAQNRNTSQKMCSFRDNLRGSSPVSGQRSNDLTRDLPAVDLTAKDGGFGDLRVSGLTPHEAKAWSPRLEAVRGQGVNSVRRGGLAWTWDVPAEGITFGMQDVVVPYATQAYEDSHGNRRSVRWIAGPPQTKGSNYLKLPLEGEFKGDPNPISMERLQPWIDCLSPAKRRQVRPVLQRMRAQGYLVETEADVAKVTRGLTIGERIALGRSVENIRAAITEGGFQPTVQNLNAAVGAGSDDKEVVTMLLQMGARPDANTMMRAVEAKEADLVGLLVSKGAPIKAAHYHKARSMGDRAFTVAVLKKGGRKIVGLSSQDLDTALDERDYELAGMLVDAGAPSTTGTLAKALTTRNGGLIHKVGRATPASHDALAMAMESRDVALFRSFTGRGARLTNNQPLYRALHTGRVDMVKLGLQHGGDPEDLLAHAMRRRSHLGIGLSLDAGAKADPVVQWAIEMDDPPLFEELMTVHRADAQQALYTAMRLGSEPYAARAISAGRANPTTALPGRVTAGDRPWIRFLLDQGAEASAGVTAAIDSGGADILAYLIELGADAGDADHVRAAAQKGDRDVLRVVIERGGGTPDDGLAAGVDQDHLEIVQYLLEQGATAKGLNVPAARGKLPMVRLLVEAGGDPTEGVGQAVQNNRDEVAVYLLDQGAKPEGLLPVAAGNGRLAICRKLIDKGIEPDEGAPDAVRAGRLEVTRFLIDAGANVQGPRLIAVAVDENHPTVAALLAEKGAAVQHVDGQGDTFLHLTARHEARADLAGVLIAAGVPVNALNKAGDSALLDAVRVGNKNVETVQKLIGAGADVNARGGDGRIVYKAAKGGKVKKLLKAAGALKK